MCGDVAGLFEREELDAITTELLEGAASLGYESQDDLWGKFVQVHVCISLKPTLITSQVQGTRILVPGILLPEWLLPRVHYYNMSSVAWYPAFLSLSFAVEDS